MNTTMWMHVLRRALLLAVCATALLCPQQSGAREVFDAAGVLNIAHRGGALEAPENTIYAFEKALRAGADVLEMDIFPSQDGVLVVFHDSTLERTTNGSGPVTAQRWDELQRLDAAYYWNPGNLPEPPYRGEGITIPSLEDVFKRFSEIPMVVEIKSNDPALVEALGSLIERYDRWDTTIVASFHQRVIDRFRFLYPNALTSAGKAEVTNFYLLQAVGLSRFSKTAAQFFQIPERRGLVRLLSRSMLRALRARGIDVHVWTVNDEADMRRLIALGVAGIVTDRPSVLADIVEGLRREAPVL